ncbi:hypothetical protein QL285_083063 [Trifolium repens]|nr:hypothetical protein QL285_083063 [Trifolium repens]
MKRRQQHLFSRSRPFSIQTFHRDVGLQGGGAMSGDCPPHHRSPDRRWFGDGSRFERVAPFLFSFALPLPDPFRGGLVQPAPPPLQWL